MKELLFSINTVFPTLLIMAVGLGARRLGWLDMSGARQINVCVYRFFIPLVLCLHIMDTDQSAVVDGRTLLFGLFGLLAVFGLLFLLVPKVCRREGSHGTLIQGMGHGNYAIFGIPLVLSMYPHADISVAAMMAVVAVAGQNVMSVIALLRFSGKKIRLGGILRSIALNPLILGTALGFLLWRLGVTLPALVDRPLRQLGNAATPLALFSLGASLDFGRIRANRRLLAMSVLGRLVLIPLVCLGAAVALGIRDVALATLIALFASPTAVSSHTMVQQLGGDADLAAAQVVFTTAFSLVTVFLWVLALSSLGFLG
ncbi:MAG: AEC family transporter [Candidatus Limiplasma sp.]|nr:AEC family transporter [Candidatus Limiplasma sp.]